MTSPSPLASLSRLPDEQLAGCAQSGSEPCFVELVRRFETRIYNFILRRVGRAADAEDLTQETFLNAWRGISRYRSNRRFSTWLFTIASRLAVDHHRSVQTSAKWREQARHEAPPIVQDAGARAQRESGAELWGLAQQVLSDEQHAALWLRYAEDMEMAEIARVLRRTRISVRVMLHRARSALLAAHAAQSTATENALALQHSIHHKPSPLTASPAGAMKGRVSCPCR